MKAMTQCPDPDCRTFRLSNSKSALPVAGATATARPLGSILPILRSAYVRPLAWNPALVSQLASLPVWKVTTDPLVANPNGLLPALCTYFERLAKTIEPGAPWAASLPSPNGNPVNPDWVENTECPGT